MNESKSSISAFYITVVILLVVAGVIAWFVFFSGNNDAPPVNQAESEVIVQTLNEGVGETAQTGDRVSIEYVFEYQSGDYAENVNKEVVSDPETGDQVVFVSTGIDSVNPELHMKTVTIGSLSILEGLSTGLEGMKEGETRRIVIPSGLALGDIEFEVEGQVIPPNSTLIYTVTLLSIL